MRDEPAISVRNLSKRYRLGQTAGYATFRETLTSGARSVAGRLRPGVRTRPDAQDRTLWALKDVNLDVAPGEVVGIVGRNGAGKSTLLKILARITDPTTGRVELAGRLGSLLEVGTGFHPELSGRENVYLYGAILGMNRHEVTKNYDQIVAFAELGRFMETPVKRYSSGMYTRLAFAVAAHLDTEILLVDEVLAVGDTAFQKKCLGKMGSVASQGRTVVFVSHNMAAIRSLCQRAVLIEAGRLTMTGDVEDVVGAYMSRVLDVSEGLQPENQVGDKPRVRGNGVVRLTRVAARNRHHKLAARFAVWEPFSLEFDLDSSDTAVSASCWVYFRGADGVIVLSAFQYDHMEPVSMTRLGLTVLVRVDPNVLTPGLYSVSCGVFGRHNEFYDWLDEALVLEIEDVFDSGKAFDNRLGATSPRYHWEVMS